MDSPAVPYAAYKSKRAHGRAASNPQLANGSASPPPRSRPTSLITSSASLVQQDGLANGSSDGVEPAASTTTTTTSEPATPVVNGTPPPAISPPHSPIAGPSTAAPAKPPATRKTSTFRHVPLRPAPRSPLPSSPLRPAAAWTPSHSRTPSWASHADAPPTPQKDRVLPSIDTLAQPAPPPPPSLPAALTPPPRSTSLPPKPPAKTPSPSISAAPSPAPSSHSLPPPTPTAGPYTPRPTPSPRPSAPYRPGFQPRGVYRPRTDEFLEIRAARRNVGRIERTRLERRLEKLIQLHFPAPGSSTPPTPGTGEKVGRVTREKDRPGPHPQPNRRASSFFDLDWKGVSTGDLWKGVLQREAQGKMDIRAAEQNITPWQDDSSVSACPLCSTSFHPLTNRKHHCRLCGRIMCSLPPKAPQRPAPCSLLFVVSDGRIEEVREGVDYGVRRRGGIEEEKFLKGVRICRTCRPVLLQQQYQQEVRQVPVFARLYEAFITLEKDIEDTLPQFQELLVSLSNDEQPAKDASAIRKHLLDSFAQYDALAKRIRKLPCAKGSSQERVQAAVLTRANIFLQRHMLPLQSISRPKKPPTGGTPLPESQSESGASSPSTTTPGVDPDSELARRLQPLLEQEALLETFVEEATAHRKFEDAKTLKGNLREIRAEIARVMEEGGVRPARRRGA